jgi:hypothetical protein
MGRRAEHGARQLRRAYVGTTLLLALCSSAVICGEAPRAPSSAEVDAELLEFLGSMDSEDESWQEKQAQRAARQQEAAKPKPVATRPPTETQQGEKK